MKLVEKILSLSFFFIWGLGISQHTPGSKLITRDSLSYILDGHWKFLSGDVPGMASTEVMDSSWQSLNSNFRLDRNLPDIFKGIGWFRYHFYADTSITRRPLALSMKQTGASEIYLDGIHIKTFGVINDSANTIYRDPQELPFAILLMDTGEHIIAVRYANYNAFKNFTVYRQPKAGFQLILGETEVLFSNKNSRSVILSAILISLMGIFFVLCLIHFFLFLFYTVSRSNLYFSILMFCLGTGFFIGYLAFFSQTPSLILKAQYFGNLLMCIGCLSLSGFLNELFSAKWRIRFVCLALLGLTSVVLRFFGVYFYTLFTLALMVFVSVEAIVIIIRALIKRVKGARIIGAGVLFFTLFLLSIFSIVAIKAGNFDINDSTRGGRIMLMIAGMAILSIPLSMSVYLAWNFGSINKDLLEQLNRVNLLSKKNLEQEQEKVRIIGEQNEMLEQKVEERTRQLKSEKKKSDDLLLNILPEEVANELKEKGGSEAKLYDNVSVLFTDFVNFTGISEKLSPKELVNEIHFCFKAFDEIIERNGLEKIKTIGDAYLAVCGLPNASEDHASKTIQASLDIISFSKKRKEEGGLFDIRIGVNSGPVVAGIVGIKKFAYDIWGDTVNSAARMEQNSESGKINISNSTYELVKGKFDCTYRGKFEAKNKGLVDMYFVNQILSEE